jgi:hypothetical protein
LTKTPTFRGGRNVAMKVPAHQFENTVEAYQRLGIPVLERTASYVCFEFGPMKLHVNKVTGLSQSEIWLEFITSDASAAAPVVAQNGFVRCDDIEPLPEGYAGFWVMNPAAIVHLVSEKE